MSDLGKRKYSRRGDRMHADVELALRRVRSDVNASAPYTAGDAAEWSGDAPTTIGEALDRLSAAVDALGGSP